MNSTSAQPPSVKGRDFLLQSGPYYVAAVVLVMHLPISLVFGPAYWSTILVPSLAMTCVNFLVPAIVKMRGALVGAVCFLSLSILQVFGLAVACGGASGMHYYFFSISAVAIYVMHGFPRRLSIPLAIVPVLLFSLIQIFIPGIGLVAVIAPSLAPWFAAANGIGSFAIILLIGILFSGITTEAELLLASETARSEWLLLNILPKPIADRLRSGTESVIADRIDEVSILFADLVGFTPYAREREPAAVVGVLNALFSRFDARVDELGLEKIKTVGDAYMVIAGAPAWRPDHLSALATLALSFLREVDDFHDVDDHRFAIRIGLHVGPVVTGVIGTRKMAYDVWGDTVNVASRLESSSLPSRIQVLQEVVERLEPAFAFERRGLMEIKGIGEMTTYFLTGKQTQR
jgi:adenylate cyclase